jgi:uncharacterized protein YqgV (UPF0045/DUF77 family)
MGLLPVIVTNDGQSRSNTVIITVDISMYPLDSDYKPSIKSFIRKLRRFDGLELMTNQLSTQVRGDFDSVTRAINDCMKESMQTETRVVFVARYLNADLAISRLPDID